MAPTDKTKANDEEPLPHWTSLSLLITHHEKQMLHLHNFSGWDRPWVDNLWAFCMSLKPTDHETISRIDFSKEMVSTFGMTCSLSIDRAYDVYRRFSAKNELYPEAMFKGITTMISDDLEKKIDYVFDIYDFNFDGGISPGEISSSLKNYLVEEDFEAKEENLKGIAELVRHFFETDTDGDITRETFRAGVRGNVVLLEVLGPCLPSASNRRRFLDFISPTKINYADLLQKLEFRRNERLSLLTPMPELFEHYPVFIHMPSSKDDMKRREKRTDGW